MASSLLKDAGNQVLFEESMGIRKMILNRPEKLNSLSYQMLGKLSMKSKAYEKDPTVKLVILKGNGKAFCVGGDVTSALTYVSAGHWSFGAKYYRKQFCLDYVLATYKKPLVAVLNGGVMGGGAGLTINSTFRIVTENTIFAMPEALLGLFPDVGASHFLSRLPGFFGEYVGLSGARLDGAEMLACGLGTHFVPSQSLENALEIMASSNVFSVNEVSAVIKKFAKDASVKQESAYTRLDIINKCFSGESCEEILSSLEHFAMHIKEKWIHNAILSMKLACPLSLKIFLRTIREGRSQNLEKCLVNEYIAVSHILHRTISGDFYEGARAMLIDKDRKPQWVPSKLELVRDEMVAKCFTTDFDEDDDWEPLQLPIRLNEDHTMISSRL